MIETALHRHQVETRARQELEALALTDELTGLPNRHGLTERLRQLMREGRRGRSFVLSLIDIDHFKRINDDNGLLVGDQLLVTFAAAMHSQLRDVDFAARYGGDEFCFVLMDVDIDAAGRVSRLIDDLLRLFRVARIALRKEAVDLSAITRSIVAELRKFHPSREVEARIADGVSVEVDPGLLRIVLENLLGNAWKFSAEAERATIEFGVFEKEGERVCFVRDNGAGFDMRYAHRLFGAFQRLHAEREFEGLAIVQRIVSRHGGRIWAEGAVGHGATFSFAV